MPDIGYFSDIRSIPTNNFQINKYRTTKFEYNAHYNTFVILTYFIVDKLIIIYIFLQRSTNEHKKEWNNGGKNQAIIYLLVVCLSLSDFHASLVILLICFSYLKSFIFYPFWKSDFINLFRMADRFINQRHKGQGRIISIRIGNKKVTLMQMWVKSTH